MGRGIVKIKDHYLEWSTIVDAPVTFGMSLAELEEHIRYEYGRSGLRDLPERLARVEQYGTSFIGTSVEDVLRGNRAGPDEQALTADEIYQAYCLCEPIRDGWRVPTV